MIIRTLAVFFLVAAVATVPNAQEEDPILLPRALLRDVVRARTHATGSDATFGMVCVNEQRTVRVPCAPDGIQLQRFRDGSVLLTLLHPDYHPMRASGRHVYIPPDPRIADLEETLTVLRAGHQQLARRLDALENGR